jgi:alpha-tubulin suppressor-like RCC1 family protein
MLYVRAIKRQSPMNSKAYFSSMAGFALFLTEDDRLLVWGENCYGTLGLGTGMREGVTIPTELKLPDSNTGSSAVLEALACGIHHTLLLTADQRLIVWGRNHMGQYSLDHSTNLDQVSLGWVTRITGSSLYKWIGSCQRARESRG